MILGQKHQHCVAVEPYINRPKKKKEERLVSDI